MTVYKIETPSGRGAARPPHGRTGRDAAAGDADGGAAARPDRDDDDRPRLHRPARRRGAGRRGARRHGLFHRLHRRHGADVGGGAARRASLWRRQRAAGAARAALRPVGGTSDRAADHGVSAARRADPARPRPGAGAGASRAGLSVRARSRRRAGAVVHRDPRLHGRGQPARAGAVDHARRNPRQRAAGLAPDVRRVRPAAARHLRRRARQLASSISPHSSPVCGLRRGARPSSIIAC